MIAVVKAESRLTANISTRVNGKGSFIILFFFFKYVSSVESFIFLCHINKLYMFQIFLVTFVSDRTELTCYNSRKPNIVKQYWWHDRNTLDDAR